ncbi:MAG: alpha/beta hydrolase [Pseudomonadota bacterium]
MPERAPYFSEVAEGPEARAFWVAAADGLRVRAGLWPMEDARGTVLIFPGRTEYLEKYSKVAADMHAMGYAAAAIDWRGQGLSARTHDKPAIGHVDDFAEYQLDVAALVSLVQQKALPQPFFLLAHSMGGCIGLRALHEALPVKAVVFSAPMWGLHMKPVLRPVAWALSWASRYVGLAHQFAPTTGPASYAGDSPFAGNTLTHDEDEWDYMQRQLAAHPELKLGGPSLHWLYEALSECRVLSARKAPATPALTFIGGEEAVVDPRPVRQLMGRWRGGGLMVLEGARHEVLMERPAVRARIMKAVAVHFAKAAAPTQGATPVLPADDPPVAPN